MNEKEKQFLHDLEVLVDGLDYAVKDAKQALVVVDSKKEDIKRHIMEYQRPEEPKLPF